MFMWNIGHADILLIPLSVEDGKFLLYALSFQEYSLMMITSCDL